MVSSLLDFALVPPNTTQSPAINILDLASIELPSSFYILALAVIKLALALTILTLAAIELAVATVILALATIEFALALTKLVSATIELDLAVIDFALATVILALARLKQSRKDLCLKETTIKHQTVQADFWVKFQKLQLAETHKAPGINANTCHKPHKAAAQPKLWQKFAFIHSTAETQLTA